MIEFNYLPSFALIPMDQICNKDGQFYAYIYDKLRIQYLDAPNIVELYQ